MVTCRKYQKSKFNHHSRQTKTIPIPIRNHPFEEIAINFVEKLPEFEEFNTILVITSHITKIQYYIPARTN